MTHSPHCYAIDEYVTNIYIYKTVTHFCNLFAKHNNKKDGLLKQYGYKLVGKIRP